MTAPVAARAVPLVGVAPRAKAVSTVTGREARPKALALVATVIVRPGLGMRKGATEVGAVKIVDPMATAPPETVIVGRMATAPPAKAVAAPPASLGPAKVIGVPSMAIGPTVGTGSVATEGTVDPERVTVPRTAGNEARVVTESVARMQGAVTVRVAMRATAPEAGPVGTAGRPGPRSPAGTTALAAVRVDRRRTVAAGLASRRRRRAGPSRRSPRASPATRWTAA